MDGMYGLHTPSGSADYPPDRATAALIIPPDNLMTGNYSHFMNQTSSSSVKDPYYYCQYYHQQHTRLPAFGSDELISVASAISSVSTHEKQRDDDDVVLSGVKAKIASHPRYPRLLQAYIDCQKVGATPEIAYLLDEIRRENEKEDVVSSCCLGADPELDEFMDTYCDILTKYKSDLSRPFEEATEFLNQIEMQFSNICKGAFARTTSEDGALSSDEECSGEVEIQELQPRDDGRELKDKLLNRFGSHLGSLKMEFSKKKKKGKLPREARLSLLEWWNSHHKWPYPTEADKIALAERTGLDPRQINNWFINQRKRHWKPSESLQFAAYMDEHLFTDDG